MGKMPKFDMDEVLKKAMGQFWRHGYSATSISDLENATGLFRGSLYHAFGGKREMFFRSLHRYDELYREAPIEELEKHPSPRQAILSVFESAASDVMENGSSDGCLEVNIALELGAHDKDVATFVAGAFSGMQKFLRGSIERGQDRGEICPQVVPDETAKSLLGLFLGLRVLARVSPDQSFLNCVVKQAGALLPTPSPASRLR